MAVILAGVSLLALLAACGGDDAASAATFPARAQGGQPRVVASDGATLVTRARMFDRAESRDSARALYDQAADKLPLISDWLFLRAAGVTPDAGDRAGYYRKVKDDLARERIPWTEAFALERFGDYAAAIPKYSEVGAALSAFRLRHATAGDDAAKQVVRSELIRWLTAGRNGEMSRDGVSLFDKLFPVRTPAEELVLARAAWRGGVSKRAAQGYQVATRAGLTGASDHFAHGTALARMNEDGAAVTAYARVTAPASLAAAASYQRARAYIALGKGGEARSLLREITARFPEDTSSASALLLLSDLASDDGRDADASETLLTVAKRYPSSPHAGKALYRAGLTAWIARDHRRAAALFDSVWKRYPANGEADAARYWAGRAWGQVGDTAAANERWREGLRSEPSSYYAVVSAKRLKVPVFVGNDTTDSYTRIADVDRASARAAALREVGMDVEAKMEADRLYRDADKSPARLVATAHAFAGTDQASRSITLGLRAIKQNGRTAKNYRLVFPILERETIAQASRRHGLDPVLVASLIRQESNYNPRAVSPVGARGLMQLMPSVGKQIAASEGIGPWTEETLFDPAINIRLGTSHLSGLFREYSQVERVLAAYNAGASRVSRWSRKAGSDDPELFSERIPFVETRDYVRTIQRNRAFYQALYTW